jgi:hemoglobin
MHKKFLASILMAFAVMVGATYAAAAPPVNTPAAGDSLYTRLGGYDALAAVTKDFIGRLATDRQLAKFFTGLNDVSKARVEAHVIDFLCVATGGPCIYAGQDMKTAHTGAAHYRFRLECLRSAPDGNPQQVQGSTEGAERSYDRN